MIYFDNASTTRPNQMALETYNKVQEKYWYNTSSANRLGIQTNSLFEKTKEEIADILNINNKKIVFTSGATEANNTAIFGVCKKYSNSGKHVILSNIEHPSVFNAFKELELLGFKVTCLEVNEMGIIDIEELKKAITPETIFVSIMWVNNIIGSIQPINEIIEIVKNHPKIMLHVDAVQGIGKIPANFDFNKIDLFTISLHKINGLKGVGILVYDQNINLIPVIVGGNQQDGKRSGTIDLASCVSAAKTLRYAFDNIAMNYQKVHLIHQYLVEELVQIPYIKLNGYEKNAPYTEHSPYVLNLSLDNMKGETCMHYLESFEIYVGIGSACNSRTQMLERSVLAVTNNPRRAENSIRISLDSNNTLAEAKIFIEKIKEIGQ